MSRLSRRGFIRQTSVGVATTGLLVAAPRLAEIADPAASDVAATTSTESSIAAMTEPVLAHVRDFASGEISLLVGNREIIYRDPELVMRLIRAAH